MNGTIRLTRQDSDRLALMAEALAAQSRGIQKQLRTLDGMMKSALMFEATATPPDVVTIDSRIVIEDLHSGELKQIELVFPEEADPPAGRLSGLSAIGCAVLALLAFLKGEWSQPFPTTTPVLISIAYLAVFGSICTFLIYYQLLK